MDGGHFCIVFGREGKHGANQDVRATSDRKRHRAGLSTSLSKLNYPLFGVAPAKRKKSTLSIWNSRVIRRIKEWTDVKMRKSAF